MKTKRLTAIECGAIDLLRQLHSRQREKLLARMRRDILANKIVAKAADVTEVDFVDDRSITKSFGVVPTWRSK